MPAGDEQQMMDAVRYCRKNVRRYGIVVRMELKRNARVVCAFQNTLVLLAPYLHS